MEILGRKQEERPGVVLGGMWLCRPEVLEQSFQIVHGDGKVQILSISDSGHCNADHITGAAEHRPAAASWRDRSGYLKQLMRVDLTYAAHNALGKCGMPTLRITCGINQIANLHTVAVAERQHGQVGSRYLEHYDVSFPIDGDEALDVVPPVLSNQMCVSGCRAVDDMKIGYNFAILDKEAAAVSQRLTALVLNGQNDGRPESRLGDLLGCLGVSQDRSEKYKR